jgi:hypothetical protein
MRYYELLAEDTSQSLANKLLDILTPIAGNGVEFVTVDQLIDKVSSLPTGLLVDREMIMNILDPNEFPLIKSIEGDKLYLTALPQSRSVSDKQKDTEADKIKKTAAKKAVDAIKNGL